MIVKEIIIKYLKDNGYDGLCGDNCGCKIDDLAPCDCFDNCIPGYKISCNPDDCPTGGGCEWHMSPEKESK